MKRWDMFCVKAVRWSGWVLLVVVITFFVTGYIISGRYGLGVLMDERSALAWHKLMHIPLVILLLVHTVPAVYLALQRWGWIRK
jgi:Ni,Fe-hydrogenase I cytochrome b subunit